MKAIKLFSMAVAALFLGACSNEDNDVKQPAQTRSIHFVATIAAPNSGTRTTYTESGTTINVAWRAKVDGGYEGDKIALLHGGIKDVMTVTAVDGSGNATIEGEITGSPADDSDVTLVYPASSVEENGSISETSRLAQLNQDGTLEYIQNNLDGRKGTGKISVSGSNATLKENVEMNSQIAIWKLSLKYGGSALNANSVTLTIGSTNVANAANTSAKSDWYICYPAAANTGLTGGLTISATTTTNGTFTYSKPAGVTLATNTYYQSTVTMAPTEPRLLSAATSGDIGKIVGDDGKIYQTKAEAMAAGKTPVAMIAYVGSASDCTHGLAIQLNSNPESMAWADADNYAKGLTAVTDGIWRLPSKADWQNMFLACAKSGDASSASDEMDPIAGFKEKIAATGTTWQSSKNYWSSTKESESSTNAWEVSVNLDGSNAKAHFYPGYTTLNRYVLGCLAF